MTNPRLTSVVSVRFLRLSLLAVLLAACAPANVTTITPQPTLIQPATTATIPATENPSVPAPIRLTETVAPTAIPAATSRGPNLEATDPTTVKLASGGLELVEFFEFW